MSIVITGASGHLGRAVTEEALQRVDPAELILVTRTPDALAGYAVRGAQVRHGDFDDPTTLVDAFAGGRRLLLISTDVVGARLQQHERAIAAAAAAGIEFVAYTSIVNPVDANPAGVVPDHKATEEALRGSGLDWALLRHSIYADFEADNLAVAAATGKLVTNAGSGRIAYVARDDCAAADAAVVVGGDHAGKVYDVTGPEALDADARAAVFAELAGSLVEVVHVDDESFATGLAQAAGMPIEFARLYASFGQATREGHLANVSNTVRALTGRAPRSLHEVLAARG